AAGGESVGPDRVLLAGKARRVRADGTDLHEPRGEAHGRLRDGKIWIKRKGKGQRENGVRNHDASFSKRSRAAQDAPARDGRSRRRSRADGGGRAGPARP